MTKTDNQHRRTKEEKKENERIQMSNFGPSVAPFDKRHNAMKTDCKMLSLNRAKLGTEWNQISQG